MPDSTLPERILARVGQSLVASAAACGIVAWFASHFNTSTAGQVEAPGLTVVWILWTLTALLLINGAACWLLAVDLRRGRQAEQPQT